MNALLKILIVNEETVISPLGMAAGEFGVGTPLPGSLSGISSGSSPTPLAASGSRWDGSYCPAEAWREERCSSHGPTVHPFFFISVL